SREGLWTTFSPGPRVRTRVPRRSGAVDRGPGGAVPNEVRLFTPPDYPSRWADIVATEDTRIVLDGATVTATWSKVGDGPFGIRRVDLTYASDTGTHRLTATRPVGLQIIGHGQNTGVWPSPRARCPKTCF